MKQKRKKKKKSGFFFECWFNFIAQCNQQKLLGQFESLHYHHHIVIISLCRSALSLFGNQNVHLSLSVERTTTQWGWESFQSFVNSECKWFNVSELRGKAPKHPLHVKKKKKGTERQSKEDILYREVTKYYLFNINPLYLKFPNHQFLFNLKIWQLEVRRYQKNVHFFPSLHMLISCQSQEKRDNTGKPPVVSIRSADHKLAL